MAVTLCATSDPLTELLRATSVDFTNSASRKAAKAKSFAYQMLLKRRTISLGGARRFTFRLRQHREPTQAVSLTERLSRSAGRFARASSDRISSASLTGVSSVAARHRRDTLKHEAWKELRRRQMATQRLMDRLTRVRERQCSLLREAAALHTSQLAQLEEISTELWNAWQLFSG